MSRGDRVIAVAPSGRFAYVAGVVIVFGEDALRRLTELTRGREDFDTEHLGAEEDPWFRVAPIRDPLTVVEQLRAEGHVAQPDHVLYAHGCGSPCGPHPGLAYPLLSAVANPLMGNPLMGNPLMGNPLMGNPLMGNPLMGNPLMGNPLMGNRPPHNTAMPAEGPVLPKRNLTGPGTPPRIAILDSGLADPRPPLLATAANSGPARITGVEDRPDDHLTDASGQAHAPDGFLDPVAGHGTFIAGLIEQLAPGCTIHVPKVLSAFGDTSESTLHGQIHALVDATDQPPQIIGLSLGGPVMESPFLLRSAVAHARAKDVVVVASAGNDGTCVPQYPAALEGVVAVGALGPDGPAPWTNYGDWVDACAPGTGLVSTFFADFDGAFPMQNTVDPDAFAGWARWSGTSFAAPVVIAAIAREMVSGDCSANEAVDRVIRAPHLMSIPCLGTVVNY